MANEAELLIRVQGEVRDAEGKLRALRRTIADLGDTIDANSRTKIEVEVDQALARLGQLRQQAESLQRATAGARILKFNADVSGALDEIGRLRKGAEDNLERLARNAALRNAFKGLGDSAAKEGERLRAEFQRLEANARRAFDALRTASQRVDFDPASRSVLKLRDNVRLSAQAVVDFADRVPAAARRAGSGFDAVEAAANKARVTLRAFPSAEIKAGFEAVGKSAADAGEKIRAIPAPDRKVEAAFSTLSTAVRGFLASLVVREVVDFGRAVVDAAVKMESLQARFAGLEGDSAKGNAALQSIRETADRLGLDFAKLADTYVSFRAAAQSVGLTAEETRDIFEGVAVATRGLGLSTDDAAGILRAFQQSLSKGRVLSEELSQQLGDRLPGAVGRLAKEIGVGTAKLLEMAENSELVAKRAIPQLTAAFVEAFGPSAAAQAQSTAANIERFKTAVFDASVVIGNRMLPAVNELLSALRQLGPDGQTGLQALGDALGGIVEKVAGLLEAFRDLTGGNVKAAFLELAAVVVKVASESADTIVRVWGGVASVFSKDVGAAFRKAADEGKASFGKLEANLKAMADTSRESFGDVSGAAKQSAEEIAKGNDELAERLRAAADRAADSQIKANKKAEDEERKSRERREKGWTSFYDTLAKLLAKQPPTPAATPQGPSAVGPNASPGTDAAAAQLDKLREQLAELVRLREELLAKPIISEEESSRASALNAQIGTLSQTIRSVEISAGAAASGLGAAGIAAQKAAEQAKQLGANFLEALRGLVTGSEEFKTTFAGLSETGKGALSSLVTSFEGLAKAGKLSQADIVEFGRQLSAILAEGGAVSAQFAASLASSFAGATGSTQSLGVALANMAAAQRQADTAARSAAASVTAAGTAAAAGAAQMSPLIRTILDARGGYIDAETASKRFGFSLDEIKAKAIEQGVVVHEVTDKTTGLTTALNLVGTAAGTAGGFLQNAKGDVVKLGEESETAGKLIQDMSGKVTDVGKAKVPPETAEAVKAVGAAGTEAGKGLDTAKASADSAKQPLEDVAAAADKIGAAKIPPELSQGLREAGTAATEAKAGIEPLAPVVTATSEAAAGLAEDLSAVREGLESVGTAVGTLAGALEGSTLPAALQGLGESLSTAQGPITAAGEAFERIATSFAGISDASSAVSEAVTSVAGALQEASESGAITDFADGFERVAKATAGVADDLSEIGESLAAFADGAAPAAEAAKTLQQGFEAIDLTELRTALRDAVDLVERLEAGLGDTSENAEAASASLDLFREALQAASEAFSTFAETDVPDLVAVLRDELEPAFSDITSSVEELLRRSLQFRSVFLSFPDDVFPIIDATQERIDGLTESFEKAIERVQKLKAEMQGLDVAAAGI